MQEKAADRREHKETKKHLHVNPRQAVAGKHTLAPANAPMEAEEDTPTQAVH